MSVRKFGPDDGDRENHEGALQQRVVLLRHGGEDAASTPG